MFEFITQQRCLGFLIALLLPISQAGAVGSPLPAAPSNLVFDELKLLKSEQISSLDRVLNTQLQATGQRLWVVSLDRRPGEEAVETTHRLFASWIAPLIDSEGKDAQTKSSMLVIYTNPPLAFIEAGIGLEAMLPDTRITEILHGFILPELGVSQNYRALTLGVLEILRALDSPLIARPEIIQILDPTQALPDQAEAAPRSLTQTVTSSTPDREMLLTIGMGLSLLLGLLFTLGLIYHITAREAHYTEHGWFHPKAWHLLLYHARHLNKKMTKDQPEFEGGGTHGNW